MKMINTGQPGMDFRARSSEAAGCSLDHGGSRFLIRGLLMVLFLALPAAFGFAGSPWAEWDGKTLPEPSDRVNDYAEILSDNEIQTLTGISARLEEETTASLFPRKGFLR